ncbi:hypothetical protein SLEP1_g12353 [Rubroshorea leprosula]|uniref:Uncharacterized protein n=1 Tax=Rubroshorea leprosula TaxID=152421 RepID=A0AAV5INM3_9ROSI|nr:hypothetical protein SLEP1_g12353 [Rubroshorea leprosula]
MSTGLARPASPTICGDEDPPTAPAAAARIPVPCKDPHSPQGSPFLHPNNPAAAPNQQYFQNNGMLFHSGSNSSSSSSSGSNSGCSSNSNLAAAPATATVAATPDQQLLGQEAGYQIGSNMGHVIFYYEIGFLVKEAEEKVSHPYGTWLRAENDHWGLETLEKLVLSNGKLLSSKVGAPNNEQKSNSPLEEESSIGNQLLHDT